MPRALFVLLLLITPAQAGGFSLSSLVIETDRGRHLFTVELAENRFQRQQGLQGRRYLAPDAGMLFDFHEPQNIVMWMKDTLIPLDMLFIDHRGIIVDIAEMTRPMSLDYIHSALPARAVLELSGGTARRLGIGVGHRVLHGIFTGGVGTEPAL